MQAQEVPRRARGRPLEPEGPTLIKDATAAEQLKAAERQIAEQARTIRRLQQAVSVAERRALAAEEATARAYGAFAAVGMRQRACE